jgi:hypothetical protein
MSKSQLVFSILSAFAIAGCEPAQANDPAGGKQAAVPALRVTLDSQRGTRWELGWGTVTAYTVDGRGPRTIRLPGATLSVARESCTPDMILAGSGALYVASNVEPKLWRVSPTRFEIERFDIELDSEHGKDFGFTGLAWSVDGKELLATSTPGGASWRIDLDSAKATRVGASQPGDTATILHARTSCGNVRGVRSSG